MEIRRPAIASLVVGLLLSIAPAAQAGSTAAGPEAVLSDTTSRAIVLFFIASDCPVSNRSIPEMRRLAQQFTNQKVRFWFVYRNVTETPATIRAHQTAYGLPDEILVDPDGNLARLTGALATPEAAVLIRRDSSLKTLYVGRIDDRNLNLGTERPSATRHDLADAILSVLQGRVPAAAGGPPVGCYFVTTR